MSAPRRSQANVRKGAWVRPSVCASTEPPGTPLVRATGEKLAALADALRRRADIEPPAPPGSDTPGPRRRPLGSHRHASGDDHRRGVLPERGPPAACGADDRHPGAGGFHDVTLRYRSGNIAAWSPRDRIPTNHYRAHA